MKNGQSAILAHTGRPVHTDEKDDTKEIRDFPQDWHVWHDTQPDQNIHN